MHVVGRQRLEAGVFLMSERKRRIVSRKGSQKKCHIVNAAAHGAVHAHGIGEQIRTAGGHCSKRSPETDDIAPARRIAQ